MTDITQDGIDIPPQDLSNVSPGSDDHKRMYHHDGSSSITLTDGSTTTEQTYYLWDDNQGAWDPLVGQDLDVGSVTTDDAGIKNWNLPTVWEIFEQGGTIKAMQMRTGNGNDAGDIVYTGDVNTASEVATTIQNALDDVEAITEDNDGTSGGGIVGINDTFTVGDKLTIPVASGTPDNAGIQLHGRGLSGRLKLADGVDKDFIEFQRPSGGSGSAHNTALIELWIEGNKANQNVSDVDVVVVEGSGDSLREPFIDKCIIKGAAQRCVDLRNAGGARVTNCAIETAGDIGILGHTYISNCLIKGHGGDGVRMNDCVAASNLHIANNSGDGFAQPNDDGSYLAIKSKSNTGYGFAVQNWSAGTLMGTAANNSSQGFRVNADDGATIIGSTDGNNTGGAVDIQGTPGALPPIWVNGSPPETDLTGNTGQYTNQRYVHDGTGTLPAVECRWDGSNWRICEPVSFQYTGDGATGRTLAGDFALEKVLVTEAGSGSAEDAYASSVPDGTLTGNTFSGELTVESTGGFTVGDNSGDADPNTDTETYDVVAE